MKRKFYAMALGAGLLSPAMLLAEKVTLDQVPQAVRTTIRSQAGASQIEDIDRNSRNGRTTYEAAFKRDGQHTEIVVNEDGSLVSGAAAGTTTTTTTSPSGDLLPPRGAAVDPSTPAERRQANQRQANRSVDQDYNPSGNPMGDRKVSLSETPAPVQRAIRRAAGNAQIEDIDRETRQGVTTYQAAFKKDGTHHELRVSDDGRVLDENSAQTLSDGFVRPLSNPRNVARADLPAPVRRTVDAYAGASQPLRMLQIGTLGREPIYQVIYNKNRTPMGLRIREDGSVLRQVANIDVQEVREDVAEARGRDRREVVTESTRSTRLQKDFGMPLKEPRPVDFASLPVAVQRAITSETKATQINQLVRGKWGEGTVYQVGYMKNGEQVRLRIAEDGTVLRRIASTDGDEISESAGARVNRNRDLNRDDVLDTPSQVIVSQPASATGARKVKFHEVPAAAQQTIRQQAGNSEIEDIDRQIKDGRVSYEIGFKRNGQHTEVRVAEDGSLLP